MNMNPGIMAAVPSAEMYPHSDPVEVTKVVILTGTVRIELVKNKDNKNSVHEKINTALQWPLYLP